MVDVPTTPALKNPAGIKTLEEMRAWAGDVYLQLQSLDPNATLVTVPGGSPGGGSAHTHDASAIVSGILGADRFNDTTHGDRAGGTLHADVVADGADGFMLGADKGIIDILALLRDVNNGLIVGSPAVTASSDGATWTLSLAGGVLQCMFGGTLYDFDCTTPQTIALTAGTNADPEENFVYLTESGGTVSLAKGTDWPSAPYCAIATVLCQAAAAPADTDGPYKMHSWTDHVEDAYTGHTAHVSRKIRALSASWTSGCAASVTMAVASVLIDITAGIVFQLHPHTMPAIDMGAGAPIFVVNQPVAEGGAYDRITDLDDLTTDANGNSLDGKHFPLVLFGVVSEAEADCKLFLLLPGGVYNTQNQAELDLDGHAVAAMPTDFVGTSFLIAKLVVEANLGGTWVLHQNIDLRNPDPGSGASSGTGINSHSDLPDLDNNDHPQYRLITDGAGAFGNQLLHIQDQKAATTVGGTFTSGAWRTRVLNTVLTNEIGASLSSNQITLLAGTYDIEASAPGYRTDRHKAKLRQVSVTAADTKIGTSEYSGAAAASSPSTQAFVRGRFTIADTETFELQHQCETTSVNVGLGISSSFGVVEVYADVKIWKVD